MDNFQWFPGGDDDMEINPEQECDIFNGQDISTTEEWSVGTGYGYYNDEGVLDKHINSHVVLPHSYRIHNSQVIDHKINSDIHLVCTGSSNPLIDTFCDNFFMVVISGVQRQYN